MLVISGKYAWAIVQLKGAFVFCLIIKKDISVKLEKKVYIQYYMNNLEAHWHAEIIGYSGFQTSRETHKISLTL